MKQRVATVLSVALTVGILAGPAFAQRPGGGPGGPGGPGGGRPGFGGGRGGFGRRSMPFSILRLPAQVQDRLGLSADQKKKIDEIGSKLRSEMQGMFGPGGGGGDREAAMAKMREHGQKAEAESLAVLKPEQKKKYEAMKAEAKDYEGLGRSSVALLAVSGLKDDQKKKLKDLAKKSSEKREKLFAGGPGGGPGGPGGGPGGPGGGPGGGGFEGMRALNEENDKAIAKILTADQVKQYEAAKPRRGMGGPGGPGGFGGPGGPGGPGGRRPGGPGGPGGRRGQ